MPLVAGPVLLFLAVEQGAVFAARAALATLAGLVGVAAFALAYGWAAVRARWWIALAAGWVAFGIVTALLHDLPWRPWPALGASLAAFGLARLALPQVGDAPGRVTAPSWDLPLRIAASVALVVTVTGLAGMLGPRTSGMLTPFPVAAAVLLGFTHAQQGAAGTIAFLRGFLPAMSSFVLFCFVLTLGLVPLGWPLAFLVALATQTAAQGLVLWAFREAATGTSSAT